jgi:hypothetical protein
VSIAQWGRLVPAQLGSPRHCTQLIDAVSQYGVGREHCPEPLQGVTMPAPPVLLPPELLEDPPLLLLDPALLLLDPALLLLPPVLLEDPPSALLPPDAELPALALPAELPAPALLPTEFPVSPLPPQPTKAAAGATVMIRATMVLAYFDIGDPQAEAADVPCER